MDAISFVFGVGTNQIRGKQLKDLVYRYDPEDTPKKPQCFVKVILIDDAGETTAFTRTIEIGRGMFPFPFLCCASLLSSPGLLAISMIFQERRPTRSTTRRSLGRPTRARSLSATFSRN